MATGCEVCDTLIKMRHTNGLRVLICVIGHMRTAKALISLRRLQTTLLFLRPGGEFAITPEAL